MIYLGYFLWIYIIFIQVLHSSDIYTHGKDDFADFNYIPPESWDNSKGDTNSKDARSRISDLPSQLITKHYNYNNEKLFFDQILDDYRLYNKIYMYTALGSILFNVILVICLICVLKKKRNNDYSKINNDKEVDNIETQNGKTQHLIY